ncbi:HotDog domain-containing protein [Entophlyctis helioformis]|nr:HotDog domain-containing protein [Entophlyctis helioformis]
MLLTARAAAAAASVSACMHMRMPAGRTAFLSSSAFASQFAKNSPAGHTLPANGQPSHPEADRHPLAALDRLHPSRARSSTSHRLWMDSFRQKLASRSASSASKNATTASSVPAMPAPKRPRDSYVEEFLRFKSDPAFLDEYLNTYGSIRVGKVLEDLDALAAAVAFLHIEAFDNAGESALTVVTASVDRIDLLRSIPTDQDVKMSGFVTYVGSSSIEISLTMETCPNGAPPPGKEGFGFDASLASNDPKSDLILTAKFVMVALNPKTGRATKVNNLLIETERDRRLFELGEEHKNAKKRAKATELSKAPPKDEEMLLIHDLYREYKQYQSPDSMVPKPDDVIWMKDTAQESLTVCMPQDRNLHGKIFGGYLMRLAFELAYANALIFAKSPIVFVALDDITFRLPVNIGSLLCLRSQVVYSLGPPSKSMQVSVVADVINPLHGPGRETTNTFHFTFAAPKSDSVPRVVPQTYDESMQFIEGRRRKLRWVQQQISHRGLLPVDGESVPHH